jgi:hypothetical protein
MSAGRIRSATEWRGLEVLIRQTATTGIQGSS